LTRALKEGVSQVLKAQYNEDVRMCGVLMTK
jgi:hypothetical protein